MLACWDRLQPLSQLRRVKPRLLGELHDLVARDREARTQVRVFRIGIGNDGIEPVVAAAQLDQDQQLAGGG